MNDHAARTTRPGPVAQRCDCQRGKTAAGAAAAEHPLQRLYDESPGVQAQSAVQRVLDRRATPPPGGAPVQRVIDLDKFFADPRLRKKLFASGLDLDDLEEVQELLASPEMVAGLLGELEGDMVEQFQDPGNEYKYTRALRMALLNQEAKWMNVGAGLETIRPNPQGTPEPNDPFLQHIATVKPLKDVGAPISHGEYAHRMQWFMLSRALENNFKERHGADFLETGGRGAHEYRWLLRTLYQQMADPEYTQVFEEGALHSTTPEERNAPRKGQFPLPLWSALLDMPGSFVDMAEQSPKYQMFGDIGAAAPVKLTGAVTYSASNQQGALLQGPLAYSQLSLAVLNRRLKRLFAGGKGRTDKALKETLETLAVQDGVVRALLLKGPDTDYDDRNEIAFRLLGIPTGD